MVGYLTKPCGACHSRFGYKDYERVHSRDTIGQYEVVITCMMCGREVR